MLQLTGLTGDNRTSLDAFLLPYSRRLIHSLCQIGMIRNSLSTLEKSYANPTDSILSSCIALTHYQTTKFRLIQIETIADDI